MEEEKKPEIVEHINLRVVAQDNSGEVAFKIKKTTPFAKLMDAYLQKIGSSGAGVRFNFEGNRINRDQTPKDLDMEDNDIIEVTVQQVGGSQQK